MLATAIKHDYRTAPIDKRILVLLDFAVELTRAPAAMDAKSIEELRTHGWSDAQILTAVQIIGFFNQYVRIAEALGVDPEPEMMRDRKM